MKYYLLALLGSILLVTGCDVGDHPDRAHSFTTTTDRFKKVTKHWEDGLITCVTIEGHRYILTHIDGYSAGPSGIVHAESCHCKQ